MCRARVSPVGRRAHLLHQVIAEHVEALLGAVAAAGDDAVVAAPRGVLSAESAGPFAACPFAAVHLPLDGSGCARIASRSQPGWLGFARRGG